MFNKNKHEYFTSRAWKTGNDVLQEPIIKRIVEEVGALNDHALDSVVRNYVTIFKLINCYSLLL